jgi:hypothetical protein
MEESDFDPPPELTPEELAAALIKQAQDEAKRIQQDYRDCREQG